MPIGLVVAAFRQGDSCHGDEMNPFHGGDYLKIKTMTAVLAMLAGSACSAVPTPSTLPLETQRDIVSNQLWFTLCKIKSNEYTDSNAEDMEKLIKQKGIDPNLIDDPYVTRDAQVKVAKNGCSMWAGKARIGDIVPKGDPREAYKSLKPWEQEVMKVLAHSGCMQRNGKWTKEQQNTYIASQIDKISTPESFGQDALISLIKGNLGVIGMLDASMRGTSNCSLPLSWRP